MTYHSRTKKPRNKHRGLFWYDPDRQTYFKPHQINYFKRYYSDTINPANGKLFGWIEAGFKARRLKKRVRRQGRILALEGLRDIEDDRHDQWLEQYEDAYDDGLYYDDWDWREEEVHEDWGWYWGEEDYPLHRLSR